MFSKVLPHVEGQLPWAAKAQQPPSSGNGLGKGACVDLERTQFLWWFKITRHKTTTREYLLVSPFLALASLPEGVEVAVLKPRKVVGQCPQPLHEVAPYVHPCVTKGGLQAGLRISHSSALPGEGGQQEGEPERKDTCPSRVWVAEGPQPGAGNLHTGTGAQALSRGCPEKFQERKLKAISSFPGLGARQLREWNSAPDTPGFESQPYHLLHVILSLHSQDLSSLTCQMGIIPWFVNSK